MNGVCGYKANVIKSVIMKKVRGFLKKYSCYEGMVWYGIDPILDDDIRDDAAKDG